jgi:hypothetical protein
MLEIVLRLAAIGFASLMMIAFGLYFTIGTDTLQHDYVFLGGGVLVLLGGLATGGAVVMLAQQVKEWGIDGLESDTSDSNTIEPPPAPARGGAAAPAPAAAAANSEDSDSE